MNVVVLKAVVEELQPLLTGGRIAAVSAPDSFDIALEVRTKTGDRRFLLLSADPAVPRMHLVPELPADSAFPAPFGQFAKKILHRGTIAGLTHEAWERVVVLHIEPRPKPTPPCRYVIAAELMGRRSNLVIYETARGTVLDAARIVPPTRSAKRPVMHRKPYVPPPPPPGANVHEPPPEGWNALGEALAGTKEGWKLLVERFAGLSPELAGEILALAEASAHERRGAEWGKALGDAILGVVTRAEKSQFEPVVYYDWETGRPRHLVAFPFATYNHLKMVRHATMSGAAQAFYTGVTAALELERRRSRLRQGVSANLRRLERALRRVNEDLELAKGSEQKRRTGELLLTNFGRLQRGMSSITVRNEYEEERGEIMIPLDPALEPAENVAMCFRQAAKAERALLSLGERRRTLEAEVAYLQSVMSRLADAANEVAADSLDKDLTSRGYVCGARPHQTRQAAAGRLIRRPYRTFACPDGWKILVGRNSAGNDYITTVLAARDDLFLHAKGVPGSHVIVRNPRRMKSLPHAIIEQAAVLAAYFSRARRNSQVAVNYTLRKYVSKPRSAKSGLVHLSRFSTISVDPASFAELRLRELDDEGHHGSTS